MSDELDSIFGVTPPGEGQGVSEDAPASDEEQAGNEAEDAQILEDMGEAEVERLGGPEKALKSHRNLRADHTLKSQLLSQRETELAQLAAQNQEMMAALQFLASQQQAAPSAPQFPSLTPEMFMQLSQMAQASQPQPEEKFDPATWVDQLVNGPEVIDKRIDKRAEEKARKAIAETIAPLVGALTQSKQEMEAIKAALLPVVRQSQLQQVNNVYASSLQRLEATYGKETLAEAAPIMGGILQLPQYHHLVAGGDLEPVFAMAQNLRMMTSGQVPGQAGKAAARIPVGGAGRRMQQKSERDAVMDAIANA